VGTGTRLPEYATLGWNVACCVVLVHGHRRRLGRAGRFGIDSLIEILASTMVVWQLQGTDANSRTRPALRIISTFKIQFGDRLPD